MEENIIDFVRECPWLYDSSRADYRDMEKKENSWRKLAQMLEIDVAEVKRKWKSLRSSFTREKKTLPSGSGAIKKKKWMFADSLDFLAPHIKEKKMTFSNYEPVEIDCEINEFDDSLFLSLPETAIIGKVNEGCDESEDSPLPGTSNVENFPESAISLAITPTTQDTALLTPKNKRQLQKTILQKSLEKTDEVLARMCTEETDDDHFCQLLKHHLKSVEPKRKLEIYIKILEFLKKELE